MSQRKDTLSNTQNYNSSINTDEVFDIFMNKDLDSAWKSNGFERTIMTDQRDKCW